MSTENQISIWVLLASSVQAIWQFMVWRNVIRLGFNIFATVYYISRGSHGVIFSPNIWKTLNLNSTSSVQHIIPTSSTACLHVSIRNKSRALFTLKLFLQPALVPTWEAQKIYGCAPTTVINKNIFVKTLVDDTGWCWWWFINFIVKPTKKLAKILSRDEKLWCALIDI